MFCGNCGKEIPEDVIFCPECGKKCNNQKLNETAEEKVYSKPKTINPKIKIGIVVLIIVIILSILAGKIVNYIQSIPNNNEIILAANNLSNDSFVATDGKWLFYYDGNGLCKEKLSNGKNKTYIDKEQIVGDVFFLGDKLYVETMSAFYTTDVKGKELTEIPNTTFCENKFQTDGKKVYIDIFSSDVGNGICSQKRDGSDLKEFADIESSKILFNGEYIYIFSPYGKVNEEENIHMGVTVMEPDGKNQKLILDFCPSNFVFGEEKIYYTQENYLYSMNFDGSNQQKFGDIKVDTGLNVLDGFIYYVDYNSKNICKTSEENPSYSTILNGCRSEYVVIVDEWIFYYNEDEHAKYRMKFDGSENQLFLE